jgi:hypothetical protein
VTVTVDSVTTGDAAPTTAPHRISQQSGKETVTIAVTPSTVISALELRSGSTVLRRVGNLIVNECVVGDTLADFSSDAQQVVELTADDFAALPDDDYELDIYEHVFDGSWD